MKEQFEYALANSEWLALGDLDENKWCVVERYGGYFACQYSVALEHDYAIVCVTI